MNPIRPDRRLALLTAAMALWLPLQRAHAAQPPVDGVWRDARRGRDLPWRLRLPAGTGPWPLVLHSHGLGGSRDGGAAWGEAWANAGIAVLHLQHPGSDIDTARDGMRALRAAASPENLRVRADDVRFMLDELARRRGEADFAALDLDAVGVSGHSFGAHTTQAIAGQRYPGNGSLADARPRAFIAFSPSPPGAGAMTPAQAFGTITRPFLAVTGSLDGNPLAGGDDGAYRATVYDGLPPGQRGLLWLDGADHTTFGGGRPGGHEGWRRAGAARQREKAHRALVARITTLWWQAHLRGDAKALAALHGAHALGAQDRFVLG